MITTEKIYQGRRYTISGIVENGKCRVREFIPALEEADKKKIVYLLKRTGDLGTPANIEKFRNLENGIFEFKSFQVRVLCFFAKGEMIILTHGFVKKKDKTPRTEIERAKRLMSAYKERME